MSTVKVADQKSDSSEKELYSFLSFSDLPAYVKEASIESVRGEGKENHAFADQARRAFPICDRPSIFVSNAFLQNKKTAGSKDYAETVEREIRKAAADFGILGDLDRYNADLVEKRAAEEPKDFTISCNLPTGASFDLFKISSDLDLKIKAAEFVLDLEKYPFSWRREISSQFVKAAETYGVDELPDTVMKYAGFFFPDPGTVSLELARRMPRVPDEGKEKIAKMISAVDSGELEQEDYFKIAELLYNLEREAGLQKKASYYKKVVGDPVDKIFTLSVEKVAKMLDVVDVHGSLYSMSDFEKISSDLFEQAFGFEKPASREELRDILPTLPRSDFALFQKLSKISELK